MHEKKESAASGRLAVLSPKSAVFDHLGMCETPMRASRTETTLEWELDECLPYMYPGFQMGILRSRAMGE